MSAVAQAADTDRRIPSEACIWIFYQLDTIMISNKTVSLPEKARNNLFDSIVDPGLSRRLDYMISWCSFQLELSCDPTILWYNKVHTKILI